MKAPLPGRAQGFGGFRWTICALLFAATSINYMDRQVLGILAPTLEKEIGWSEIEYSNIVTAFQAAYAIGLVGFGRWVDVIGTRHGYAISIVAWSIAAMAHALVRGVMGFGVARFALGLGEAGNFPAAVKAVAEWFPRRERALATGLFNSGSNVGAILAPVLVPWLTVNYGWPMAFILLGASGFVWLFFWYWLYTEPAASRRVSPEELALIKSDPPEPALERIPWRELLRYRQTWAFVVGISFSAPIWWFYLYWLPKFLHKQHGLDLSSLGPPLVAIYTMTCFGSIAGGWFSGFLLQRGWSLNASRKVALLACALCVVPVVFAQSAGFILQTTGSYWSLFALAGSAYLVALAIMHLLIPGLQPVELKRFAEASLPPRPPPHNS